MDELLPATAPYMSGDFCGQHSMPPQPSAAPSRTEVLEALEHICRNSLKNSERLAQFLSYVVTETLEGRDHRIKSYSIGLEVFNKTDEFDGGNDSIVRSTANRLRSALDDYYTSSGANDPVVISLPKGRYVPLFSRRNETQMVVEASAGFEVALSDGMLKKVRSLAPLRFDAKLWRTATSFALAGAMLYIAYDKAVLPPTIIIGDLIARPPPQAACATVPQ